MGGGGAEIDENSSGAVVSQRSQPHEEGGAGPGCLRAALSHPHSTQDALADTGLAQRQDSLVLTRPLCWVGEVLRAGPPNPDTFHWKPHQGGSLT